ncbi:hypothetical protein G7Y31_03285 [Corynebacterium lizhenjunii]|uniref:Uncharacterized protein n=1 Tax=Corynebacterium lizhenjunii TaxID=2709394 RepID=A0A7T0KFS2_9CORY|nr:hypothetical protein [Corynebacterium lizhenjunii]QPK79739.1 hypothetical protein G7Y31_03285 [Corynebacterium lizhenjunii]
MAITFDEAVEIARAAAAPHHLIPDFIQHGEGAYCFETDRHLDPMIIGPGSMLIVFESDGSVIGGSSAPTYTPRECEVLAIDGRVLRTFEQVRAARLTHEAEQAALEAESDGEELEDPVPVPATGP